MCARAAEAMKIGLALERWLDQLDPSAPLFADGGAAGERVRDWPDRGAAGAPWGTG